MALPRSLATLARRTALSSPVRRSFATSFIRRDDKSHGASNAAAAAPSVDASKSNMEKTIYDIRSPEDLLPEGAQLGTVPTDFEQATGLERLEILGKMQGIDIFDMKPLPSDRVGTIDDPIVVQSFGEEQYVGCTGCPADSHSVLWITLFRHRPLGRCVECGSCYKMEYVGPEHVHHGEVKFPPPKLMSDFVKPEYYYK